MIKEHGQMEVLVDGKIELRRYTINNAVPYSTRYLERFQKFEPEVSEGESFEWVVGSDIPIIVKAGFPLLRDEPDAPPFPSTGDQ